MIEFCIPWPYSKLSPNIRQHWASLAKAKKKYKTACYWSAYEQGVRQIDADKITVHFYFHPPNKRKYDIDNLVARMKAGIDGIADLIKVDDANWIMTFERLEPKKGGEVKVIIEF